MNFVKNETLKLWILSKNEIFKMCEFLDLSIFAAVWLSKFLYQNIFWLLRLSLASLQFSKQYSYLNETVEKSRKSVLDSLYKCTFNFRVLLRWNPLKNWTRKWSTSWSWELSVRRRFSAPNIRALAQYCSRVFRARCAQ